MNSVTFVGIEGISMRILGLIAIFLFLAVPVMCEESAASGVNLVPVLKPGDVSRYIVKVQAAGTTKLPSDEKPLPIKVAPLAVAPESSEG